MKINLTSILVDDQEKALAFYTEVLGFLKKNEIPLGQFKWLTVVSPENSEGVELLLEPNQNPAARTYQKALFDANIPAATFFVDDLEAEYEIMKGLGVVFTAEPAKTEWGAMATFNDTCGNLIMIHQHKK